MKNIGYEGNRLFYSHIISFSPPPFTTFTGGNEVRVKNRGTDDGRQWLGWLPPNLRAWWLNGWNMRHRKEATSLTSYAGVKALSFLCPPLAPTSLARILHVYSRSPVAHDTKEEGDGSRGERRARKGTYEWWILLWALSSPSSPHGSDHS